MSSTEDSDPPETGDTAPAQPTPQPAEADPGGGAVSADDLAAAAGSGFTWNPDGDDVAKSLVSRAKAAGRAGGRPGSRADRGKRGGQRGHRRRAARAPGSGWSGPGGDDRDPQSLEATMDRLVGEHGWEERLAVHGAVARWDQVVGPDVAAHVRPEGYAEGVLTVRAESTAWATQVRLFAADLVAKLNREVGDGTVVRVQVLGPQAPSWNKGPRRVPGRGPRDTYG
ncbi:putative nucleic acid-binding Zn ribbon protein [Haloactinopolyspora alba]|uniref:Putative nucleic acid-binding Zn ribbon protein n=1 Tax=Haloactinopolyspora alba TaxID=648780 RepID=A0A2P8DVY4_9ACTN|nr:DciA family protein [Haloactinopolyspora alba]PSL01403.1 putative nucleic acid-binding Zn ribbon protein [Haloactinopolyspora alba]